MRHYEGGFLGLVLRKALVKRGMRDLPNPVAAQFNGQSLSVEQLALAAYRSTLPPFLAREYPGDVPGQIACCRRMLTKQLNRLQRQAVNEQLAELNGEATE